MLGVPSEQISQILKDGHSKVSSFIEKQVEATLTTIPMQHNYFWRVYINGCYSPDCCPNYLKRELFQLLRNRISRIHVHTRSLADFLSSTDQRFSIFVLLDHMDWLSSEPRLLEEEWRAIISHAEAGARIIYRSGSVTCDCIPAFARRRLQFESDHLKQWHPLDRVGTYASFHFAKVTA